MPLAYLVDQKQAFLQRRTTILEVPRRANAETLAAASGQQHRLMAQSVTPLAVLEAKPRTETDCPYGPWKQRELRDQYRKNKLSDPLYHESRGTEISWCAPLLSSAPLHSTSLGTT